MELHGEKLAGDWRGEDLGLGGGESVVRDERQAGDAAQEVPHGQAGEQGSAVVVQSPGPAQHHQSEAVTNSTWGEHIYTSLSPQLDRSG